MDFLDKYAPGLFARIVSRIRRPVRNDEVDSVLITQAQFDETLRPILQGQRDEWSDFEGDLVKATAPDSISPGLAMDEPPVVNINDEWEQNYAEQTQWDYRFSIKDLMAVTAFAAVMLTLLKLFGGSLTVTALVLGVAVGLGVVLMHYGAGFGGLFYLCWWLLLATYLIISMVAMVQE